MKTTKKQIPYNIDYINETITVTKKFLKAASVYNSPEYKLMKEIRADYPTFKFAEKEIDKKAGKITHKNLTFETMREHIILCEGEKSSILEQYDYLMEFYKTHGRLYRLCVTRGTEYEQSTAKECLFAFLFCFVRGFALRSDALEEPIAERDRCKQKAAQANDMILPK